MKRVAALAFGLALALAGCSSDTTPRDSGIEGVALAGPQCPVEQAGSPCPDRPIAIEMQIVERDDGTPVARVTSELDGRFRLALRPGRYRIEHPQGRRTPPTVQPQDVEVREGSFTTVTVRVDTGIR